MPWLKSTLENEGPFLSVYLDTTRTDPNAAAELATRWGHLRSQAAEDGAPEAILEEIEESVLRQPSIGGRHGRAILASGTEILIDRVLPVPPHQESAHWGEHPQLLPLLQLTPYAISQLLVEVDRAGADLHLRASEDPSIRKNDDGLGEDATVDGGHDELHKANLGGGGNRAHSGWRQNNYEARVEDSWERNAEAVADTVNRLVMKHKPDMVLLTGDVRALSLLKDELGQEVVARLHEVSGGTRGVSLERASFREELERVTQEYIDARQRELAEELHEKQARDAESLAGAAEVEMALDRGQVDLLIFVPGREPENIETLMRKAIDTDAGIAAVGDEFTSLPEGVGALLRWKDDATPSNSIGSMSGDQRREDAVVPERDDVSPREAEESALRG
nr:Vms1/Ankzf1 family peptidyl-tRNA hydrolase [Brevibacterium daeguense]